MNKPLLSKQLELMRSTSAVVLLVTGVGFGKTYCSSLKAAISLLEGHHIIVTAQSYKSLKIVLFEEIQERLRELGVYDDCVVNKADMTIFYPAGNGKIWGFSADEGSVEGARGVTADMLIMDEAAIATVYAYRVLQARLRRPGWVMQTILITTPRGTDNWVYTMSLREDVHFIHAKTSDNIFLPDGFYDQMLLDYAGDEALMRQELEASFEEYSDDNVLITPHDYRTATTRIPVEPGPQEKIIAGFDVARKGKDRSALVIRQGGKVIHYMYWRDAEITQSCDKVMGEVVRHRVDTLVIDGVGLGAGAYDILNQKLARVCEVVNYNGAYAPIRKSSKFANARAESWFLLKDWLKTEGSIPDKPEFKEMTAVTFKTAPNGKILLDSKADLNTSPDIPDALSITFSSKVKSQKEKARTNNSHQGKFIG